MEDLSQYAISCALKGEWNEALKANFQILKLLGDECEVDVLNRIARAYAETGQTKKAISIAKKVIKIDPFNSIAQKTLERFTTLESTKSFRTKTSSKSLISFLEETGKTKIIPLINITDAKTLLSLDCGDELNLAFSNHTVSVNTPDGKYVGKLPDDLAHRLVRLHKEGNKYSACVKSTKSHEIKIFIREVERANHIQHLHSFPTEKLYYSAFTAPEIVHKKKSLGLKR